MKKYIIVLALFIVLMMGVGESLKAGACDEFNGDTRLAVTARVWGFLKYYHPSATNGNTDMDQVLFNALPHVRNAGTVEEFNRALRDMIFDCGRINMFTIPREQEHVPLLDWIDTCPHLDAMNTYLMRQIKRYHVPGDMYYVAPKTEIVKNPSFNHEKAYKNLPPYPPVEYRLLSLFRYWNIINYFFPYPDLLDDWDGVLLSFIPKMENATTAMEYQKTILNLAAQIHDSHAETGGDFLNDYFFGYYFSTFYLRYIENRMVVAGVDEEEFPPQCDIRRGDILLNVDGVPVEELIEQRRDFFPTSHEGTLFRDLSMALVRGSDADVTVTVLRNGEELTMTARRYHFDELTADDEEEGPLDEEEEEEEDIPQEDKWRILEGNVGYINTGLIRPSECDRAMADLKDTVGIIQDCRGYSRFGMYELGRYFFSEPVPFYKVRIVDYNYPGRFLIKEELEKIGEGEPAPFQYTGKLVLLVNHWTQSASEFHVMSFQQYPGAVLVGTPTAGADGNVSRFSLPGGISTAFSGVGILYPDGSTSQRYGIQPDIVVTPTLEGFMEKRDEVRDAAVEYILQHTQQTIK